MGFFSKGSPFSPAAAVNMQAVAAFDQALGALGPVAHALSPGGQPIYSVGVVSVAGPRPYTLLVTYGFSEVINPDRLGSRHEYSLAIPYGEPVAPWADAFLRSQCASMMAQNVAVNVGDCIPFNGIPMTYIAFQPEHHAAMPPTSLVGMFVADDPAIASIETPRGPVDIRRIVGADQYELDRALTWDPAAFLQLMRGVDPLLLSPLSRPSYIQQAPFREAAERGAQADGSTVEALVLDFNWQASNGILRIMLPQGPGMVRALNALRGRVGRKRKLVGFSQNSAPTTFTPGAAGMTIGAKLLELTGDLESPPIATIVAALEAGAGYVDLPIQAPSSARARADFFAKVTWCVKSNELGTNLNKELRKLLDEARAIAAVPVDPADQDADRQALSAVIRTLRFTRVTDQSVIEEMIRILQ